METNYNKLLYEKMQAENETFKDWLLSQEPAEILNHAYEYTIYQDMMLCMEDMDLSPKQAKAMYQSPKLLRFVLCAIASSIASRTIVYRVGIPACSCL